MLDGSDGTCKSQWAHIILTVQIAANKFKVVRRAVRFPRICSEVCFYLQPVFPSLCQTRLRRCQEKCSLVRLVQMSTWCSCHTSFIPAHLVTMPISFGNSNRYSCADLTSYNRYRTDYRTDYWQQSICVDLQRRIICILRNSK